MALTAAELAGLRAAVAEHFGDACVLLRYTDGAADVYNVPAPDWVADAHGSIPCSFDPRPGPAAPQTEAGLGRANVALYDARVRLPVGAVIGRADRVRLVRRHGAALAEPLEFSVAALPLVGATAITLLLRLAGTRD